jgi:hypothetical protein
MVREQKKFWDYAVLVVILVVTGLFICIGRFLTNPIGFFITIGYLCRSINKFWHKKK